MNGKNGTVVESLVAHVLGKARDISPCTSPASNLFLQSRHTTVTREQIHAVGSIPIGLLACAAYTSSFGLRCLLSRGFYLIGHVYLRLIACGLFDCNSVAIFAQGRKALLRVRSLKSAGAFAWVWNKQKSQSACGCHIGASACWIVDKYEYNCIDHSWCNTP